MAVFGFLRAKHKYRDASRTRDCGICTCFSKIAQKLMYRARASAQKIKKIARYDVSRAQRNFSIQLQYPEQGPFPVADVFLSPAQKSLTNEIFSFAKVKLNRPTTLQLPWSFSCAPSSKMSKAKRKLR